MRINKYIIYQYVYLPTIYEQFSQAALPEKVVTK